MFASKSISGRELLDRLDMNKRCMHIHEKKSSNSTEKSVKTDTALFSFKLIQKENFTYHAKMQYLHCCL